MEGAGHHAGWPRLSGTDFANTSCFSLFKELGRIEDASVFFKMILVGDKQLCPCLYVVNPTQGFLQRVLLTGTVFSFPSHKCSSTTGGKHQGAQWGRTFHCLCPTDRFHRKHHNGKCPPILSTIRCLASSSHGTVPSGAVCPVN